MTSYRGMDGVSGRPGTGSSGTQPPTSATSFSGNYIPGLMFETTQAGCFFEGYWWWVPTGGLTAPQKFCLWCVDDVFTVERSKVIADSIVTSGTLSATPVGAEVGGHFNFVPLPAPIPISLATTYCAAAGVNGPFPDTQNQFGSGQPYSAGIVNGPLNIFSDHSGSNPEPMSQFQGPFTTAGSDPTVNRPFSDDLSDILWLDVQVRDDTPAGYKGNYELWPNKTSASLGTIGDSPTTFVLSHEIHVSAQVSTFYVKFYSNPSSATSLPTWAGIYDTATKALVSANTSPTWTKLDGTPASVGDGWIYCTFSVTLPIGVYKVCVYNANGAGGTWSATQYGYFSPGGPGGSGLTWGPLFAPPPSGALNAYVYFNNPTQTPPYTDGHSQEQAQGSFAVTGPQYPYLYVDYTFPGTGAPTGAVAESFWVDLVVGPPVVTQPGAAAFEGSGGFMIGAAAGIVHFRGSGSFSAKATSTYQRGLVLHGSGAFNVQIVGTRFGAVALNGSGSFTAGAANVTEHGTAHFSGSGSFVVGNTGPGDIRTALHLTGTFTETNQLGGTVTNANVLGGSVTNANVLGGSAVTLDPVEATLVEWTMQEVDINLAEFNDETLNLTLASSGSPLNLTGFNLNMYLKVKQGDADSAATTTKLSTTTGEITITNASQGLATVAIPNSDLQAPSFTFYRVDLVGSGSKQNTAIYGKVSTTSL